MTVTFTIKDIFHDKCLMKSIYGYVYSGKATIIQKTKTSTTRAEDEEEEEEEEIIIEKEVVLKEFNLEQVTAKKTRDNITVAEDAYQELSIHSMVSAHPEASKYIVEMYGMTQSENDECMTFVMEHCVNGDLFKLMKIQPESLSSIQKIQQFKHLCHGVHFLHSLGIAHRDLSLENLFLDADHRIKIGDFGCAIQNNRFNNDESYVISNYDSRTITGKIGYVPIEVAYGQPYNPFKMDTWALGVILFILFAHFPPFTEAHFSDNCFKYIYKYGKMEQLLAKWKVLHRFSATAIDLLKHLFCPLKERYTIQQILAHEFFQENNLG